MTAKFQKGQEYQWNQQNHGKLEEGRFVITSMTLAGLSSCGETDATVCVEVSKSDRARRTWIDVNITGKKKQQEDRTGSSS
jgi:hypothetical protein